MPDFNAGAMENWGLVIYREMYLLYDKNKDPLAKKKDIFDVITHEMSHQWVLSKIRSFNC